MTHQQWTRVFATKLTQTKSLSERGKWPSFKNVKNIRVWAFAAVEKTLPAVHITVPRIQSWLGFWFWFAANVHHGKQWVTVPFWGHLQHMWKTWIVSQTTWPWILNFRMLILGSESAVGQFIAACMSLFHCLLKAIQWILKKQRSFSMLNSAEWLCQAFWFFNPLLHSQPTLLTCVGKILSVRV